MKCGTEAPYRPSWRVDTDSASIRQRMRLKIAIFAAAMLVFGTVNTIATKMQDITIVGTTPRGKPLVFSHPAFQSACMFLGEFACLVPYFSTYLKKKPRKAHGEAPRFRHESWTHKLKTFAVFALPALCDSGATTLLNVGLLLTYASVFQMLRGTMVIFTGILTVLLLKRRLHTHHWLGVVLITAGAAIVGASSVLYSGQVVHHRPRSEPHRAVADLDQMLFAQDKRPEAASAPLLGDLLIVGAQVLQASQFIIEEKFLAKVYRTRQETRDRKYRVPALLAVGLEGFWGLVICAVALPVLTVTKGPSGAPLDSLPAAIREISHSKALQWSTFGSIASIAFFNFFGISVTKQLSGAGRATIDASRTVFVWMFSLWIGWESFHGLEVLGFLVILSGSSLYNELIRTCLPKSAIAEDSSIQEPLLADQGNAGLPPLPPGARTPPSQARPRSIRPSQYTLARSLRAGPTALSPHSLTGPEHVTLDWEVVEDANGEEAAPTTETGSAARLDQQ